MMKKQLLSLTTLMLSFSLLLSAQTHYVIKDFQMSIAGTSSLHDWESDVTNLTAEGKFQTGDVLTSIENLEVEIPVADIKSSKGSIMDNKTYKALKYEDHPVISYRLNKVQSITANNKGITVKASGQLTIAGTTRDVSLTVEGRSLPGGGLEFTGAKALKMTDFNVDPPTALMGTIKTGDDITVKFKITMGQASTN